MKNLKHAAAGCGVVGLISVFLPWWSKGDDSISLWKLGEIAKDLGESPSGLYLLMICMVAGAGIMIMSITKGGITKKLAIAATCSFGLGLLKAFQFRDHPLGSPNGIGGTLCLIAAVGGVAIAGYLIKNPDASEGDSV